MTTSILARGLTQLRARPFAVLGVIVFLMGSLAAAQNITGTVTNGTTGKPSAGDEVTLLSLSQGMQEVGHTKSDSQGHFSLASAGEANGPRMVRVTHDGVNYFPQSGPLMPGTTTAELTVYDAGKKAEGLSQTVEVHRLQSDGKQLQAVALYAIRNESKPPHTVADEKHTYEFVLPDGAVVDSAQAKGPGGQPIATEVIPLAEKNHYAFNYPLRPGETQFQVVYQAPYSGELSITPKPLGEIKHYVVMTPKGMTFTPKIPQQFSSMPDDTGAGVMVATNVKPGQDLSFRISGAGVFPDESQQGAANVGGGGDAAAGSSANGRAMGGAQAAGADNRPGGGLGAPIDVPDPLHDYRAYILGAFALVLVMGGFYVVSKSNQAKSVAAAAGTTENYVEYSEPSVAAPKVRTSHFLEALKEELFELEVERQHGTISEEEYAKAKTALDATIKRALARRAKA